jgi:glycine oxidase
VTAAESADVVVVGAGAIGLALSRALALRGVDVVVVERGEAAARATSALGAAAGMINPQAHAGIEPPPMRELGLLSRHLYPEWIEAIEEASGLSCEYDARGGLVVVRTEEEEVAVDRALDWQRARALPFEVLSSEEAVAREPSLTPETRAAFAFPLESQVAPARLGRALAFAARAAGVRLLTQTPVTRVLVENGRAAGVEIGSRRLLADAVVNAAGAWSAQLSGAPSPPVEPVRGQLVSVDASADADRLRRFVTSGDVYVVPRRDGSLVIGSTVEHAGFDARPTAGGVASLLTRAAALVPAVARYPLLEAWAGLRPGSPDGIPILGETALPGYWMATGHFKNGILLAPASAALLADVLTGLEPALPLAPFSPARFGI